MARVVQRIAGVATALPQEIGLQDAATPGLELNGKTGNAAGCVEMVQAPARRLNPVPREAFEAETRCRETHANCIKRLPETVPVVVGAHQPFVPEHEFLASGPQLPPCFGAAEIDICLAKVNGITKPLTIEGRARTEYSGVLSLQEEADPRPGPEDDVEAQAVQIEAIVSGRIKRVAGFGSSAQFHAQF